MSKCIAFTQTHTKWAKKNHVPQTVLDEWVNAVLSKVKSKATSFPKGLVSLSHSPFFTTKA